MFRVGKCLSTQNRAGNRRPSLNLNFQGGSLDSRVTFSRTSNATLTGSDGLIQYAPHNTLLYSEQFDNAAWVKTLGSVTAVNVSAPNGTLTADVFTPTAQFASIRQALAAAIVSGQGTVSLWVRTQSGTRDLALRATTSGVAYLSTITATSTWTRFSATFTYDGTTPLAELTLQDRNASGFVPIEIWGAQLNVGSLQPYYPTTTAAYYGPRFDYDPITLACKGLLIEEQRVNLLTYSDDFSNAAWTKSNITITANSTISPNGSLNAMRVTTTATAATEVRQDQAVASTNVVGSVYMKKGSGATDLSKIQIRNQSLGTNLVAATINLDTGAVTYITGSSGVATTDIGNGWWRVTATATITSGNIIRLAVASNGGSEPANIYSFIWGAQLEAGAFATSYIPTVASQVTRTADNASMTGTNFSSWYNANEGTLLADYFQNSGLASGGGLFAFSDNSNNNRILLTADGASSGSIEPGMYVTAAGVAQASIVAGVSVQNSFNKLSGAYQANNFACSFNGAASVVDTSGVLPFVDRAYIGAGAIGATYINGTIKSISYYPRRLTNQELAAITT